MSTTPAPSSSPSKENVSKKTMGLVSLAVMSSRLLGLIREMVLNGLFGGTRAVLGDALTTAFALPKAVGRPSGLALLRIPEKQPAPK